MKLFPDQIDHFPLLLQVSELGTEYISSLQESKVSFAITHLSNGQKYVQDQTDWGSGFYVLNGTEEAFYSTNKYDGLGTELNDLVSQFNTQTNETKELDDKEQNLSISKSIIDITSSGYWTESYLDQALELIKDISALLVDQFRRFAISLEGFILRKNFQSSEYVDITQSYSHALLTLQAQGKKTENPLKRVEVIGGINRDDLQWNRIEEKVEHLKAQLNAEHQIKFVKPDQYDVVLSPDAAYTLAHETIGHGSEADQIISNRSFLSQMLGHKVASGNLTIIDDPLIRASGWMEYDDEGLKGQGTILVDEGIMSSFLHSNRTAKFVGDRSTGNARATSYISAPSPRQSNLYIEPGDFSENELIENVKTGLYMGPSLSASMSIYTGEYSIESQYCYEIVNGQIGNLIGPATISGYSLDTLNNVTGIGNKPETLPALCIKDDSKLMIGAVSPPISLKQIFVS